MVREHDMWAFDHQMGLKENNSNEEPWRSFLAYPYLYVAHLASYLDSRSMPQRRENSSAPRYVMQPIYGLLDLARHAAGSTKAC